MKLECPELYRYVRDQELQDACWDAEAVQLHCTWKNGARGLCSFIHILER